MKTIDFEKLFKRLKHQELIGKTLHQMSKDEINILFEALMEAARDKNPTGQLPFCQAYPTVTGYIGPTVSWCLESRGDWCSDNCIWALVSPADLKNFMGKKKR